MIPRNYNDVFFDRQLSSPYKSAEIIVPIVNEWVNPKSVIDIGCGVGLWLKTFKNLHVNEITGVDSDHVPVNKLLIDKEQFIITDLEKPIINNRKYELAICLEVAEHLSSERAESFIGDLCLLSDVILFSAAIKGQEGTRHINEQYPDYWIKKFQKNGYECIDCLRPVIWNNKEVEFWYKQNIMLFIKESRMPEFTSLRELAGFYGNSLIHPDLFDYKTNKVNNYGQALKSPIHLIRHYLSKIYHSKKK